jgi:hypothetical protein
VPPWEVPARAAVAWGAPARPCPPGDAGRSASNARAGTGSLVQGKFAAPLRIVSPHSSGDRALASGARCEGSNPSGGTFYAFDLLVLRLWLLLPPGCGLASRSYASSLVACRVRSSPRTEELPHAFKQEARSPIPCRRRASRGAQEPVAGRRRPGARDRGSCAGRGAVRLRTAYTPREMRQMMISEFGDWLRTQTNKQRRPGRRRTCRAASSATRSPRLPADPYRLRRPPPPLASPRPLRGPGPADRGQEHREHPLQAKTTGQPRHPRRDRIRVVRSATPIARPAGLRPGRLTQPRRRKGHQLANRPLRFGERPGGRRKPSRTLPCQVSTTTFPATRPSSIAVWAWTI